MASAMTMGNVIVYGGSKRGSDGQIWGFSPNSTLNGHAPTTLGNEEMQHTFQGEVLGPLYYPAHISLGVSALISSGQYNSQGWHTQTNVLESCPHSSSPSAWGC